MSDATTLLKLRCLLEKHKLGEALFAKIGEVLQANGLKVVTGTIVDATRSSERRVRQRTLTSSASGDASYPHRIRNLPQQAHPMSQ